MFIITEKEKRKISGALEITTVKELAYWLQCHVKDQVKHDKAQAKNVEDQDKHEFRFIFETEEVRHLSEMSCLPGNEIFSCINTGRVKIKAEVESRLFIGDTDNNFIYYLNVLLKEYFFAAEEFVEKLYFEAARIVSCADEYRLLLKGDTSVGAVGIIFLSSYKREVPKNIPHVAIKYFIKQ
jgi:hypothetical protein